MQGLWSGVGKDARVLAERCLEIAIEDPAYLTKMAADLAALRRELEPATTVAPTTAAETTAAETTAPATVPATESSIATDTSPPPSAASVMPRVLCTPLANALARLEAVGVTAPVTFDATGAGRIPTNDGTWIIVTQSPGPDRPLGDGAVRLGAVRAGERSPC